MVLFGLLACQGGTGSGPSDTTPTDTTTTSSTTPTSSTTTPTGSDAVTFYGDVQPLLSESCARCHTGSGFGPGPFLDYGVAVTWAEVMLQQMDAGLMPPPAADPTCHPYQEQEAFIADPKLRDTLSAWIDAGEPKGVDPGTTAPGWTPRTLENPDTVMKSATPRVPQFADGNEYVCLMLGRVETDEYITGLEFLLDHPEVTHHALLILDTSGTAHNRITDQETQSWKCPVTDIPGDIIHAWAPSGGALTFPPGTGMHVPAGSELILQVHYYEAVTDIPADQPGYAFTTAPTVDKEIYYLPVGPLFFVIPAGDSAYSDDYRVPVNFISSTALDVWGAFPHMHVLGTAYDFHVESGGGGQSCISRADQYDFSLQPTYWFDDPVTVQPSDTLSVTCTWDNSADNPLQFNDPPKDVTWGENTQDEMCYAFLYVTEHGP